MNARRRILALALPLYTACSAAAVLTPPEIEEQPHIRTIYEWGGQVAVIARRWLPAQRTSAQELSVVDESTSRVVPVRVPGCNVYHDVAYGALLGRLLVCGTKESARVYRQEGANWIAASEPLPGDGFRFAVDGNRIAVVSKGAIFLMSVASSDRRAATPARIETEDDTLPSALMLVDDVLLAAYDFGEFGGGLYRRDLKHPEQPETRLIRGNVKALARAASGEIWAAGGMSHMTSVEGALYRIGGKGVEVVAAIRGLQSFRNRKATIEAQSGARFPGLTTLSGLALGVDGRPTIVLPTFGVFEYAGDALVPLYREVLQFNYKMPTYGAGSSPVGLAFGQAGEMYVASAVLGIFVLRKNNGRYDLRQLLFQDPAQENPPASGDRARRP